MSHLNDSGVPLKARPSVAKRQKERARSEKKKMKAEKREFRKDERESRPDEGADDPDIAGIVPGPQALDVSLFGSESLSDPEPEKSN